MTTLLKALVVEPDTTCRIELIDGSAQSIKNFIDGWLEAVGGVMGDWTAYGDEEGRLKGLDPNPLAAMLIVAMRGLPVIPVGTVVFLGQTFVGGEDGYIEADVPQELVQLAFPLHNEPS